MDTIAGVAICEAPSMIACRISFPCAMLRLTFSIPTVASSTRMPTASASPPSVITLSVWPSAASPMIEHRMASGIDVAMMSVLRQLPRKSRIMRAVRHAAIIASRTTPEIEERTKIDWSASSCMSSDAGSDGLIDASSAFTSFTTVRLDAFPFFSTLM